MDNLINWVVVFNRFSSTRRSIPRPQPARQRAGVERHDVVDAGEEQYGHGQLERERDDRPE